MWRVARGFEIRLMGEEGRGVGIVPFSEVMRCPEFRLDPERYIPVPRKWECGRGVKPGSRGRHCKGLAGRGDKSEKGLDDEGQK